MQNESENTIEPKPVTQKVCQWNAQNICKKYLQAWFEFHKLKKPNWDLCKQ